MNYAFSSCKRILPLLLMLHLSLCLQPAWAQDEPLASPSPAPSVSPSPSPGSGPSSSPSPNLSPEPEWIPRVGPSPEPDPTPTLPPSDEKNPWLAAGFSLLLPGSGQMYVEERVWPEVLITAGMALAVIAFVVVDQQRAASIKDRPIDGGVTQRLADAHWDALTLLLQIGVPSLWLWNAGDAFSRAERSQENVIPDLERDSNAYIIEENLVSVTLWQF